MTGQKIRCVSYISHGLIHIGLFVLLVFTGLHFKKVRDHINDLYPPNNIPSAPSYIDPFYEILRNTSTQYGILLTIIVVSTIKFPILGIGLVVSNAIIMVVSFVADLVVASMYASHIGVMGKREFLAESISGLLFSLASLSLTLFIMMRIRSGQF